MLEIGIYLLAVVDKRTEVHVRRSTELEDVKDRVAVGEKIRGCYQHEEFTAQFLFVCMPEAKEYYDQKTTSDQIRHVA